MQVLSPLPASIVNHGGKEKVLNFLGGNMPHPLLTTATVEKKGRRGGRREKRQMWAESKNVREADALLLHTVVRSSYRKEKKEGRALDPRENRAAVYLLRVGSAGVGGGKGRRKRGGHHALR